MDMKAVKCLFIVNCHAEDFDAGRFRSEVFAINLGRLDTYFKDGETSV